MEIEDKYKFNKSFLKMEWASWKVVIALLEESCKLLICDDGENKGWDDL